MNKTKALLQTIRAPFLILTPICVFLGVSIVVYSGFKVDWIDLFLVLLGALSAHISVNTLNEYQDFKSGLDLKTEKTPFSGGSGTLPTYPALHKSVLKLGIVSLSLTILIGCYFIAKFGLGLLPLGVLGVLIILSYTTIINKNPIACLIAPGLGFSLIVIGTQYIMTGSYLPITVLITLVPFLLVNNLLLLNQYPDIEADKSVGRNHLLIAYGIKVGNIIYAVFLLLFVLVILIMLQLDIMPKLVLITLLPLPFSLFALSGVIKYKEKISTQTKYLAANVIFTLLVPVFFGLSIFYSANT